MNYLEFLNKYFFPLNLKQLDDNGNKLIAYYSDEILNDVFKVIKDKKYIVLFNNSKKEILDIKNKNIIKDYQISNKASFIKNIYSNPHKRYFIFYDQDLINYTISCAAKLNQIFKSSNLEENNIYENFLKDLKSIKYNKNFNHIKSLIIKKYIINEEFPDLKVIDDFILKEMINGSILPAQIAISVSQTSTKNFSIYVNKIYDRLNELKINKNKNNNDNNILRYNLFEVLWLELYKVKNDKLQIINKIINKEKEDKLLKVEHTTIENNLLNIKINEDFVLETGLSLKKIKSIYEQFFNFSEIKNYFNIEDILNMKNDFILIINNNNINNNIYEKKINFLNNLLNETLNGFIIQNKELFKLFNTSAVEEKSNIFMNNVFTIIEREKLNNTLYLDNNTLDKFKNNKYKI